MKAGACSNPAQWFVTSVCYDSRLQAALWTRPARTLRTASCRCPRCSYGRVRPLHRSHLSKRGSVMSPKALDERCTYGPGIEVTGRVTPEYAADPDSRGDGVCGRICSALSADVAPSCSHGGPNDRRRSTPASCRISWPRRARFAKATGSCAPVPADIQDRRVEITGPVDRKMIINALNSGASVFMADFEDANTPKLGQQHPGTDQPARRDSAAGRLRHSRRQALQAEREDGDAVRAAAWLASAREARHSSTARRSPGAFSISRCTSSTTPRS